ncbi:GTPase-associated system all-helical protein GASH [Psychrobacter cryohalolentis]|uniref:GTPase-associated system all-helical protein GASH n=1 Tax=Psychrobacter cryohalolentis TaxID=330922 RepID=UPI003F8685AD
MSTEVLMQFLDIGLIDLQSSDEKLEKLEKTSSALSDILEESPSKALSYIYIACNARISESDCVVQEAIAVLKDNWPTYSNAFKGKPITVVRALLLQALVNKLEDDMHIAIAFNSIARNIIPYTDVGKEGNMWRSLIRDNDIKLNLQAEEEWSAPEQITIEPFSYKPPKSIEISSKKVKLDRESLQTGIEKAIGPQNKEGQATDGNRHWPNSPTNWSYEFAPFLTTAIADIVDEVLEESKIEPIDLSAPLKKLSEAVENHINNTVNQISVSTGGLQKRTSLIWWKESLYSPSANCSYREIPLFIMGAVMSYDIFNQVPTLSPASVTAFLRETVLSIETAKKPQTKKMYELISELRESEYAIALIQYVITVFANLDSRGPVIRLLSIDKNSSMPDETRFLELTGIKPDLELSNSEWAVWVFRELQAMRAVLIEGEVDE